MARSWFQRVARLVRHRWHGDTSRSIPRDMVQRLAQRVAQSEQRHGGEIRVYAEAALPASYVMRDATPRERAISMFGKLRVWDTEHNNGVLVYLLLAERAIEIVGDRGLTSRVPQVQWERIVDAMREALQAGRFEEGLALAIDELTQLLVQHFPLQAQGPKPNELPDEPLLG